MCMYNSGLYDGQLVTYGMCAVRPIVCIPTSAFNDKYSLVDE